MTGREVTEVVLKDPEPDGTRCHAASVGTNSDSSGSVPVTQVVTGDRETVSVFPQSVRGRTTGPEPTVGTSDSDVPGTGAGTPETLTPAEWDIVSVPEDDGTLDRVRFREQGLHGYTQATQGTVVGTKKSKTGSRPRDPVRPLLTPL